MVAWRWKAAILFHISGELEYIGKWPLRVISGSRMNGRVGTVDVLVVPLDGRIKRSVFLENLSGSRNPGLAGKYGLLGYFEGLTMTSSGPTVYAPCDGRFWAAGGMRESCRGPVRSLP